MSRRVTKFKRASSGVYTIVYEQTNASNPSVPDEYTIRSIDEPRSELMAALGKMATHVAEICEFPPSTPGYTRPLIVVSGITITYSDEGVQGLVISASASLKNSNAPLIINTPHFSREPYSPTADPDVSVFSVECARDLDRLEVLILKYVDGDRSQQDLFGATA